jgi:hypothetical protein
MISADQDVDTAPAARHSLSSIGPGVRSLSTQILVHPMDVLALDRSQGQMAASGRDGSRASAGVLLLSGMRVGAFVSLPLAAAHLDPRMVKQWPSLGVRAKFKKHATTYLPDIPDLSGVVRTWDSEVRAVLPPRGEHGSRIFFPLAT